MATDFYSFEGMEEVKVQMTPILSLEEGDQIVCTISQVREVESSYGKGKLVDCCTVGGTEFVLRGHTILVQKLTPLSESKDHLYIIRHSGQVGRAVDYFVARYAGTGADLAKLEGGAAEIERVESFISELIDSQPPRD